MKRLVSAITILSFMSLSLGCASYVKLSDDKYLVTQSTQDPVMWGVSNSDSVLTECKGTQREGYNYEKLDFTECKQVAEVKHTSAPGYGSAIVSGLLNALTFGLIAAFWGGGGGDANANASSNSSSNAAASSAVNIKGGHK